MDQDPASGLPDAPQHHDTQDNPGHLSAREHTGIDAFTISHSESNNLASSPPSSIPPAAPQLDGATPPSNHAVTPIDPDDFYKSYRVSSDHEPSSISMTPAATRSSRPSNGTDDASSQSRSPTLSGLRSASATATVGRPHTGPSVKDLKKRFDQNGSTSAAPRAPNLSNAAAHQRPSHAYPVGGPSQNGTGSHAAMKSNALPVDGADTSSSGINPASNPHSFASRINSSGGATMPSATSSGIHRARKASRQSNSNVTQIEEKAYAQPQAPLLFGEILPQQCDTQSAGHGIEEIRPRRMSESNTMQGNSADLELGPSSTTSSYKSAATHHTHHSQDEWSAGMTFHSPRTRSQSDASSKTPSVRTPMGRTPGRKSSTSPQQLSASHSSSKLPVPVRKLNSPGSSDGTSPSRASSPSVTARSSPNASNQPRTAVPPQAKAPTSRAKTPTARAKTPTNNTKERRPPPTNLNNPHSHVQQHESTADQPTPKHSPPLRRSRQRQPVTSASTVSSRMRSASRTRSPHGRASKTTSRGGETGRRRKISVGPIDFEQRREHIRLAYSKSIRASQALEARQRAVEQEMLDQEGAADVDDTQPPLPSFAVARVEAFAESQEPEPVHGAPNKGDDTVQPSIEQARPLTISTTRDAHNMPASEDSPTLGVPGTFPQCIPVISTDERPLSTASGSTEFDGEAQTNPPVPAQQDHDIPVTVVKPPSPGVSLPTRQKTQNHDAFVEGSALSHSFKTGGDASAPSSDQRQHSRSHQAHDSTATIQQFSPSGHGQAEETASKVPFPRMETQDDSECQSDADGLSRASQRESACLGSEYAATDACTEETDDRNQYDRQYEQRFDELPESQRESTYTSSDVSGTDDIYQYSQSRGFSSASGNLALPSAMRRPDRMSHQSTWTDMSVDSSTSDLGALSGQYDSRPTSFHHISAGRPTMSPRESSFSHRTEARYDSSLNSSFTHQLPELDTGAGFSIPYLSPEPSHSLSYLPSPNHEPPPIPKSVSGSAINSRTSSMLYEQSQSGSTLINSERDSYAYASYADTPRSGDATSLETADNESGLRASESDGRSFTQIDDASSKERHRLMQRRNVIKELVDTEAVFVRDMNIVEEIYKGTAEACPRLDDQTVKLIFRNSHEIIEFHTTFLAEVKGAVAAVYVPKGGRTAKAAQLPPGAEPNQHKTEPSDLEDRDTSIGPVFHRHLERMKVVHEGFLRNSDQAAKKLIQIQQDSTVKVWLTECNEVAKDLTAAWDLDSLLIKPMQRITKYPTLIMTLLQHTPEDHPDRESLISSKEALETAIIEINKTKKNFELVGQIVGRKRKESDVKAGFARAFGKRVDKLQASGSRPPEDAVYARLNEKFGDDFVQLQVVLRDVEFYTRQVSQYVHEFLQYLSSIELVMRLQPGSYPEIESKWVQFNISMRDLEKAALEDHVSYLTIIATP